MNITVVGAGYVGLVTSACFAHMGHAVTCVETNVDKVAQLQKGECPIYEPQLKELLLEHQRTERLQFTSNAKAAYRQAEVIFIAVGTPEKQDGSADLTAVFQVAEQIKTYVKQACIVVVKSTVPVGTNAQLTALFDSLPITVVSNPEFLREGTAIHDFFYADRIVLGTTDSAAIAKLQALYSPLEQPIVVTSPNSAELTKYASNAFLATKISFINEIAAICEKVGADVEEVARCMGMDRRIGASFLKAGIGYGGSCFPKDTKALMKIAGNASYDFELLKSVINVNQQQIARLMAKVQTYLPVLKNARIAVLGLAFKPNTDDVREAPALFVIEQLLKEGAQVVAYDPVAITNAKKMIGDRITYTEQLHEALAGADLALVLTEWTQLCELCAEPFLAMRSPIVIDGRNCLDDAQLRGAGITYEAIGRILPQLVGDVR